MAERPTIKDLVAAAPYIVQLEKQLLETRAELAEANRQLLETRAELAEANRQLTEMVTQTPVLAGKTPGLFVGVDGMYAGWQSGHVFIAHSGFTLDTRYGIRGRNVPCTITIEGGCLVRHSLFPQLGSPVF